MKSKVLTFLFLILPLGIHSQTGKLFDADKQLSSSFVCQAYLDRDGFIWIATRNGLNKYDRYQFRIYNKEKEAELEEKKADLLILPIHDNYSGKAQNVMKVLGTPHRVTPEKLAEEKKHWEPLLEKYPSPRIGVLVGGATKDKKFTLKSATELVKLVKSLNPASLLVTTSRRTPTDVVFYLKNELPDPKFFYRFGDKAENPYFGLLSMSDVLVVTGDSMSMCSECAGSGVPMIIFAPREMVGEKHSCFHEALYQGGYAVPATQKPVQPQGRLNPAYEIAERIKRDFL